MIADTPPTQAGPEPVPLDLDDVVRKVQEQWDEVPERRIREVVQQVAARFRDAPVRAFVPIFVQRRSSERLRREQTGVR